MALTTPNDSWTRKGVSDTHLGQICSLDVDHGIRPFRMTSVICTIGPSCEDVQTLAEMINAGMNICRLNLAHNTLEYHSKLIKNIREAASTTHSPSPVGIAVEIPGQGIRLGTFLPELGKEVFFAKGTEITLTNEASQEDKCSESQLYVNSLFFLQQAQAGQTVFISDGVLSLTVKEKMEGNRILAVVATKGMAGNNCHIHIPKMVPAPVNQLTDVDKTAIKFAMEHNVDMIFAAWVWTAEVIKEIRAILGENATTRIVANIENYAAIKNFDAICEEADGVMVARGDLGMDLPPEKVFLAQKNLISRANVHGKPVICAAQMLESMSANPRPTRAEASDVANAILDGTDCVMLSRETAMGVAPTKALKVICSIAREAEMAVNHDRQYKTLRLLTKVPADNTHTTAIAAVEAAHRSKAHAIIVVTNSGTSAMMIARYRPPCLIVAVTKSADVVRALHLHRSIYPVVHEAESCPDWADDVDFRIHHAMTICRKRGYFDTGDVCVLVSGSMPGAGWTNTVRAITVPPASDQPAHYVNVSQQAHLGI